MVAEAGQDMHTYTATVHIPSMTRSMQRLLQYSRGAILCLLDALCVYVLGLWIRC